MECLSGLKQMKIAVLPAICRSNCLPVWFKLLFQCKFLSYLFSVCIDNWIWKVYFFLVLLLFSFYRFTTLFLCFFLVLFFSNIFKFGFIHLQRRRAWEYLGIFKLYCLASIQSYLASRTYCFAFFFVWIKGVFSGIEWKQITNWKLRFGKFKRKI